jgi:PAS domain S-box-containing protein
MRLAELQILASFSQVITAETDLNNLYRVLHEQIIQTFGADLEFAIALYNEADNMIEFPYFYEQGKKVEIQGFPLGEGLTSTLITQQKPMLLQDERSFSDYNVKIYGKTAKSWLGAPLKFTGSVIGAIIMQDLENENRFTQDDVNLISTLASQIAIAVRNTQLYTETQRALKAFDQEHFLLNTLLDYIPEEVSFKDVNGCYIRASESMAKLLDTTASSIIGKTDFDLLDPETAEQIRRAETALIEQDIFEVGLIQARPDKSGKTAWVHTSRIPFRSHTGETYGLLTIHRDITELKQAEELAQHRAEQVTIAAEIARDATGTLEVKPLLQKAINLIHERFGFYHSSIFLVDPSGEYAVLQESTGEAGRRMLLAGHRLAVGSKSIVGQVTATGRPFIVNNVHEDPMHFPNPLLPETKSEMAIPLKVGVRVLGTLDVQSTQVGAFNAEEDISVLQILADQLAVAVVNGALFAKTQELLGKHRLLRQVSIAASASSSLEDALVNMVSGLRAAQVSDHIAVLLMNSEQQLQVHASAGYEGTHHRELRIALGEGITGQSAEQKRPVRVDDTATDPRYISVNAEIRSELAVPILYNDEILGVLNLESAQPAAFDENDEEILGALGNNLGGIIANFRLVAQIRQQVARERQLFDVTSKIRRTVDLETILQATTEEIARTLGARRAQIHITAGTKTVQAAAPDESGDVPYAGSRNGRGEGDK